MTYIICIITILSVFNDGFSACAASFAEERKEQEDPQVLISNKISTRNISQIKIHSFAI